MRLLRIENTERELAQRIRPERDMQCLFTPLFFSEGEMLRPRSLYRLFCPPFCFFRFFLHLPPFPVHTPYPRFCRFIFAPHKSHYAPYVARRTR